MRRAITPIPRARKSLDFTGKASYGAFHPALRDGQTWSVP